MDFDVIIVGYGPAGAIAASWLGQFGMRTLVIEKTRTIWDIPRAIALDHEILRVLQNLGIAERVLPHTAPFGASEHFGMDGQLIRRIDVAPPPHPLGYPPSLVFTQPAVEQILRQHVSTLESVTVLLGCELTGVSQGSTVTVETNQGRFRGKYLIACDGASSTVRQLLGLRYEDLGFDEPWIVVDILVNGDALGKLPGTSAQYCDPKRPMTFVIGPGNHRRWEIMLSPGEDPREMEREENVWRLLSRWLSPGDGKLWRANSYRFHALVAERWRDGHVFLAGDAAHQQPPFLGQGMCQGIRDVTNLCWKLRSGGGEALLQSYETERKAHVRTLTERIKAIGKHICVRDPELARQRDAALLEQGGGKPPVLTRQDMVPPLAGGFLQSPAQSSGVGTLFPQPWVAVNPATWARLDDVLGHDWRLVADGRRLPSGELPSTSSVTAASIGDSALRERDGITAAWFDRHGCAVALLRPDHYVFGTANGLAEIDTLLHQAGK